MSQIKAIEVVGGGLIGTSIALKSAALGIKARIRDENSAHQAVANQLLGDALLADHAPVDLIVVAIPVNQLAQVIVEALLPNPNVTVIDTGSIKTKVILEVSSILKEMNRQDALIHFVPTHPMAGREVSGPDGARSDLFEGRAWAITPHPSLASEDLLRAEDFIQMMGATTYLLTPEEHDRQVAMTSHLPQLLSSALSGVLNGPLDLAGAGLRDMSRLAHSEAAMWQPILEGNRNEIIPLLHEVVESINRLIDNNLNKETVLSFMEAGANGASKVPGKHGGIPRNYGSLSVVIPDAPGQLALLFNHCAEAKINIEDLRIEHSPGQETGLISLYVQPGDLSTLNGYLSTRGWQVTILQKGH